MAGRDWTHKEIERLGDLVATQFSWQAVADRMPGRDLSSCRQKARRLGWFLNGPYAGKQPSLIETLRRRHAEGWSDMDIARELKRSRSLISRWRRDLGLPSLKNNQRHRAKQRDRMKRQLRRAGMNSLAEVRVAQRRRDAVQRGWPADCSPLECQALEHLEEHGEGTYHGLCEALGKPYHKHRCLQLSSGLQVFASLTKKGYARAIGRRQHAPGKGRTRWVYVPLIRRRHTAGLTGEQVRQQREHVERAA